MKNNKTTIIPPKKITRKWYIFDAENKTLGRLASEIAQILIGKNKPEYALNHDNGDYVVVINSDKVRVTGTKSKDKKYYFYSGFPHGLKEFSFTEMMNRDSTRVISLAVKNMLPKNRLQKNRLFRLKVFKDTVHPYQDKLKNNA